MTKGGRRWSRYKPPSPGFGGKSRIAAPIWAALGDCDNYIEPFAGSLGVLLGRPAEHLRRVETVNDIDGMIGNFWRAVSRDPEAVAQHADWPVSEVDLSARHAWLVRQRNDLTARLMGDPDYFNPKIAGWWVWGICQWIGSGWCSGSGPWQPDESGRLVKASTSGRGVNRKLPHLGDSGRGVNRQIPSLGGGSGINRKCGNDRLAWIVDWFWALRDRLRDVRITCGDWRRVVQSFTARFPLRDGVCGILLDPPYGDEDGRCPNLYSYDSGTIAADVRAWAIEHGNDDRTRIALCSYDGAGPMPDGWRLMRWETTGWSGGGYGNQGSGAARANRSRECVWLSRGCLDEAAAAQGLLFGSTP